MATDGPGTTLGEGAEAEVDQRHRDQQHADQTQGAGADGPALRHLHPAQGEYRSAQRHVAKPVGHQAQGEDLGDHRILQAEARIQPVAEGDTAHPGTEVEVEGIADEGHRQDLRCRQAVPRVALTQQVEAGVDEIASQCRQSGEQQRLHAVRAQGGDHFVPVDLLRQGDQQHHHHDEERVGQKLLRDRPPSMAFGERRLAGSAGYAHWPSRCRLATAGDSTVGGSMSARRGGLAGNLAIIEGK